MTKRREKWPPGVGDCCRDAGERRGVIFCVSECIFATEFRDGLDVSSIMSSGLGFYLLDCCFWICVVSQILVLLTI